MSNFPDVAINCHESEVVYWADISDTSTSRSTFAACGVHAFSKWVTKCVHELNNNVVQMSSETVSV